MADRESPDTIKRMRDFHNRLRVMIGLDRHELVAFGVLSADDHNAWGTFVRDPFRWLIRADDETAMKLWMLIERRASLRPLETAGEPR